MVCTSAVVAWLAAAGDHHAETGSWFLASAAALESTHSGEHSLWGDTAATVVRQAAERWRGLWEVLLQYSSEATRLHLALFYFYGIYYQWSKRLTGGGSSLIC